MNIGIVSGKGGAGKTLVAVNLAYMASKYSKVSLYDLDVEEPNSFLFFNDVEYNLEKVEVMIPSVDMSLCNSCGICSKVCEFNAIINLDNKTLVFPELCHSCYSCLELCPRNAISEGIKEIGEIRTSINSEISLIEGRLNINETAAPALIREVKKKTNGKSFIKIFDSPPGTSCSVVEAIKDVNYIVLVAEPTIFGFHDFRLMADTIKSLNKKFGVIINKHTKENKTIENYCLENRIEIIGTIPLSFDIATINAHGKLICENDSYLSLLFKNIFESILERTNGILV